MIRVLISYAWDTDEFSDQIWQLAGWLEKAGMGKIKVITDHLFKHRPPPKGWPVWMQEEIHKATIVLSVCTPKYISNFEKQETDLPGGFGVTLEGALITQLLMETKMLNEKFFPILPKDGHPMHIPTILRAYNNGHRFPAGSEGILKLILGENPCHEPLDISAAAGIASETMNFESNVLDSLIGNGIEKNIMSPIQILVRAFLSLSELDKISVSRSLNLLHDGDYDLSIDERDRAVLQRVKAEDKLPQFWEAINRVKPFESNENPFT